VFFSLSAGHHRCRKEEGRRLLQTPCFRGGSRAASGGGAWRRRAATSQMPRNLPATVPVVAEGLPCNSCRFWGAYFVIFKLNLIFWFLFFSHVKDGGWENHHKKRCVCVFVFLFMSLNYKNKKDTRIGCLIWIWLNILRKNKIMLYFPRTCFYIYSGI